MTRIPGIDEPSRSPLKASRHVAWIARSQGRTSTLWTAVDNALHFADGSDWKLLTRNSPSSWEQPVLENAGIVNLVPNVGKSHWFVFYSARAWDDNSYAVGYADCGETIDGDDNGPGEPRCYHGPRWRRERTNVERSPRQARSRATVDSILEAAAQILSQDGSRGLSTNRIAARAGVAVASLYQYFPNKQAILDVLFEKQLSEEREEFTRRSESLQKTAVRDAIREAVQATIDVHVRRPTLVRSILRAVPFVGGRELHVRARQEVVQAVSAAMREREEELRPARDVEMRAFLVVHAVEAAIHDAADERPEYLRDPTFADELTEMIERFLLES